MGTVCLIVVPTIVKSIPTLGLGILVPDEVVVVVVVHRHSPEVLLPLVLGV